MNEALKHKEVLEFIRTYTGELSKLAFQGSPFPTVSVQELLEQIDGYRRSEKKLPKWYATPSTLFPPKLNLEQTSSEITAEYKASIASGKTVADLTGGFGVDTYAFSKRFEKVYYFEQNSMLAELADYNFHVLGAHNIETSTGNGLESIENKRFDIIYLDPARRDDTARKVFRLSDTEPDVTKWIPYLLSHCTTLLIKTSPMLDLTEGLRELGPVKEIHIVALQNEVKEVLWVLNESVEKTQVIAVNLGRKSPDRFTFEWGSLARPNYSDPLTYLYEPNAAIMKSGGMDYLTDRYSVYKLAPNAHLFTSKDRLDFPGRAFRLLEVLPYKKTYLTKFKKEKANITTRDFPLSVAELRKKWNIREGGNRYLFFTTLKTGDRVCLSTEKIE